MFSTVCSLMLATSSMSAGQPNFFSGGCGSQNNCNDEGYGKFGSYGSYGSYGTTTNCSNGNCGSGSCGGGPFSGFGGGPFGGGSYAQNLQPGQSFPYVEQQPCKVPDKDKNKQDKKVAELLDYFDGKLRDIEKSLLEADHITAGQLKQMLDARDKQFADRLAEQAVTFKTLQEVKVSQAAPPVNLEPIAKQLAELSDSLAAMQSRLEKNIGEKLEKSVIERLEKSLTEKTERMEKSINDKLAAAKREDHHVAALADRMVDIANTIGKSSGNEDVKNGLRDIVKAIEASKSTAPNLHAWHLDPRRGLIVVRLPADAKLYLDGLESPPGKDIRSFISPTLEPGKRYYYTLRVLLERDGKVIIDKTDQVFFVPGQERQLNYHNIDSSGPFLPLPAITNQQ